MAANPISYTELEAYERKALVTLSAWETDLIMRLDDTVLDVRAANAKTKTPDAEGSAGVDINDRGAVRGLLSGIRDRLAAKKKPKKA